MRYPEFLKPGGTVGFVAPSFGSNMEPYRSAFDNALVKLSALGYNLKLGPNCYAGCGIGKSNTSKACGDEIMDFYCSEGSDVLISCGGGELMCEDLDYIDFERIKAAAPKWFMGYSDNTNLTFLLTTIADTASIYGPCAAAFGMEPWHESIEDAHGILTGKKLTVSGYDLYEVEGGKDEENPLLPYNVTEPCVRKGFPQADSYSMEGRLVGGCMDILTLFLGTKYDHVREFAEKYSSDGIIWFMEACDLNTMGMRRALWQMEQAGWFKYVKGFMIGRPYHHGEITLGLDQYDAVTEVLKKYKVPILMDLDIGHIAPAMPLICGSYAKVNMKGGALTVEMLLS